MHDISNDAKPAQVPNGLTLDSQPQAAFSLPNGTELRNRIHLTGRGELTVENGTLDDAVVQLVDLRSEKAIRMFYVKTDHTFTERQVPRGLYGVYFATGMDWNAALRKFNLNPSYSHFGRTLEYTEKIDKDSEKVERIIYKITLQPVQGGDVEIEPSDKDAFDRLMNDGG